MCIYKITNQHNTSIWKADKQTSSIYNETLNKQISFTPSQKKIIFKLLDSKSMVTYEELYQSYNPNDIVDHDCKNNLISIINKMKSIDEEFHSLIKNQRDQGYIFDAIINIELSNEENSFLINKLSPILDSTSISTPINKKFYGREWLVSKLQTLLKETDSPIIIMDAIPGLGKTSICKHLELTFDNILCAVYCDSYSKIQNIENIIRLMVYHMCLKNPLYGEKIINVLKENDSCLSDLDKTVNVLLIDSISRFNDNNSKPIIIIDSIDAFDKKDKNGHIYNSFLTEIQGNHIIKMLMRYFRFILSFNSAPHLIRYFNEYPRLQIQERSMDNFNDIKEYVKNELENKLENESEKNTVINEIVKCSEGNFLYTSLIVKEIKENKRDLCDKKYPKGLNNYYLDTFKKIFRERSDDEYETRFVTPLSILASFPEGVPSNTLNVACTWNVRQEQAFLMDFPYFVEKTNDDYNTIKITHKSLNDWLLSESSGIYRLGDYDIEQAKQLITQACFNQFKKKPNELNDFEMYHLFSLLQDNNVWIHNQSKREGMRKTLMKNTSFYNKLIERTRIAINNHDFVRLAKNLEIMESLPNRTNDINIYIYLLKGIIAEHQGNLNEAKTHYENGISSLPNAPENTSTNSSIIVEIYSNFAFCLYRLTNYKDAISTYKTLINYMKSSNNATTEQLLDAEIDLANTFRVKGDYTNALNIFGTFTTNSNLIIKKEFASNPRLQYKRYLHEAWTYRNVNNFEKSFELYKNANELYITHPELINKNDLAMFRNNAALIYMNNRQFKDAQDQIESAIYLFSKIHGESSIQISDFYITLADILKENAVDLYKSNNRETARDYFLQARYNYNKSYEIRKSHYDNNNSNLIVPIIRIIRLDVLRKKFGLHNAYNSDFKNNIEEMIKEAKKINAINLDSNNKEYFESLIKESEDRVTNLLNSIK